MRHILATTALAGFLSVLMLSSDAQAFGHKKQAPCPPPVVYCPPPPPPVVYCPPPPPPVVHCPPPPCQVTCETPKKKCGLFGGGGLFGGKHGKRAAPVHYVAVTHAPAGCCH